MCILLFFIIIIIFICSWNYQEQIEIDVCFVDLFSPLKEGVKLVRNFLIFWNGDLHCYGWKNDRIPRSTKQVQKQKVQLKFEGMQLKEAVSFHWATVFLWLYPKHMVHLEVCFGFTRMEHLNFNSSVKTSFSKCVCLVFDYCQFDCSLHIKCYFHSWN